MLASAERPHDQWNGSRTASEPSSSKPSTGEKVGNRGHQQVDNREGISADTVAGERHRLEVLPTRHHGVGGGWCGVRNIVERGSFMIFFQCT